MIAAVVAYIVLVYLGIGVIANVFTDWEHEGWAGFFFALLWPIFLVRATWRALVWLKDEIVDGEVGEGWRRLFPKRKRPPEVPVARVVDR